MKTHAGFTLLEVMLAVSILATALVLTLDGFSTSMRAAKLSERYTVANMLLQRKIADLELLDAIETGEEDGDFADEDGNDDYPGYRWTTEVVESEDIDGLLEATVKITWQDRGHERSAKVVRLFAKPSNEEQ